MSLAALWNIPKTSDQLAQWSFVNAAAHRDIVRIIFQKSGRQLDSYVLDPIRPHDEDNFQAWLYQHQVMHQQMDAILGIQGYDLLELDFSDDGLTAGWVQSHAIEHQQAGQILGLG
jgi:hypothetical protein